MGLKIRVSEDLYEKIVTVCFSDRLTVSEFFKRAVEFGKREKAEAGDEVLFLKGQSEGFDETALREYAQGYVSDLFKSDARYGFLLSVRSGEVTSGFLKSLGELLKTIGEEKLKDMMRRRLRREGKAEGSSPEVYRKAFARAVLKVYSYAFTKEYGNKVSNGSYKVLATLIKKWTEYLLESRFPKRKDPETLLKFSCLYILFGFRAGMGYKLLFGMPEEGWKAFYTTYSFYVDGKDIGRTLLPRNVWARVMEEAKSLYSEVLAFPEVKEFVEAGHVVF